MVSKIKDWSIVHPIAKFVYPVLVVLLIATFIFATSTGSNYKIPFIFFVLLVLYIFRPNSIIYHPCVKNINWFGKLITAIVALITILACTIPMGNNPNFSGIDPGNYRNEYPNITESFLNGRLDFNYGDEDEMLQLANPYNPKERESAGIASHWDHAYYNNHYYMYFGVVPALLVFLPYRLITGHPLSAYIGTQVFVILAILGIFTLFYYFSRRYFKKMPFIIYLLLSICFSVISVWYSIVHPALYCTAIISAVALAIWSLFFFIRALRDNKHQTVFLVIGAILGSLTFGCRPTIALFNIILIPFLFLFIKQQRFNLKSFTKICLVVLPYILVGAGLMWYNYARFDSPFEFGQTYQITLADQTTGELSIGPSSLLRVVNDLPASFFKPQTFESTFPFVTTGDDLAKTFSGIFFVFPIFILVFAIFNRKIFATLKKHNLLYIIFGLIAAIFTISIMDIVWAPFPIERYHLDIYFLVGILCFLIIGSWYQTLSEKPQKLLNFIIAIFTLLTLALIFLYCVNFIQLYFPEIVVKIGQDLHLL